MKCGEYISRGINNHLKGAALEIPRSLAAVYAQYPAVFLKPGHRKSPWIHSNTRGLAGIFAVNICKALGRTQNVDVLSPKQQVFPVDSHTGGYNKANPRVTHLK